MKTDSPNLDAQQVYSKIKTNQIGFQGSTLLQSVDFFFSIDFSGLGYLNPRTKFELLTLRYAKFLEL